MILQSHSCLLRKTWSKRIHLPQCNIVALFTITKTWKQPKCPSSKEWIKKIWYLCAMEYYSTIKKYEIMPFVATWMDLEIPILNEMSQPEKEKYCMILLMCEI